MLRRLFAGVLVLALACTLSFAATQVKEMQKTAPKSLNTKSATIDINSAPEADLVGLGIDKAVAKKIVDGRPYRSKRELVTKKFLTADQYNKMKDQIVAKQPKKNGR